MYTDLIKPGNHIHFIGIGGVSMSGLAKILNAKGITVTGSDINHSVYTDSLECAGIKVDYPHTAKLMRGAKLVVYTAAVKEDNPEMIYAAQNGIPKIERAKLLGVIMKHYSRSIAVSGTHGKTTVTSMLAKIMLDAGLDPTVTVGGELEAIGGNLRIGKSENFLTEACEYVDSFLNFFPSISLILNIEEDHLDYFSGIEQIKRSFRQFASQTSDLLIVCGDDKNIKSALEGFDTVTFGFSENCRYRAEDISENGFFTEYTLIKDKEKICTVTLSLKGRHNIKNSLAALACADALGIDLKSAAESLNDFKGAKRRLEYKGSKNGFMIYDDYAHHPTEIKATLQAASTIPHNKIWCIFQPHTYTRTKALLDDFAEALMNGGNIIITDIYAAREKDTGLVTAKDLAAKIDGSVYISSFDDIKTYILENAKQDDIVITMGAGTVSKISNELLK
ncbi:MAG: UDP-N-acetylmuramate--L-alanine ligase [Clostridia bacterium]|nr:UDP-N-acetylmuramate--L-alanine ligase [Clostridia bacterium]